MSVTLTALMMQRYDTAANWTVANPTLLAGEIGIESDTEKIKIGDGATAWSSLGYQPWSELSTYPFANADIAAGAEIAVSKLANGTARQLLQTDAAGTGVEFTSNIDVPGTLDVTSAATFDNNVIIQGDLTVNGLTSVGTIATGVWNGTAIDTLYGGTGQTTYTDGQLLIGKTDGTLAKATLTAGTGITITNGDGSVSIASSGGTVTSVTATSPLASSGGTTPDISIQDGTTTQKGAVQLEDSTSSTSTTKAATPASVKAAYDLGFAALPATGGTLTGNITLANQFDLRFGEASANGSNYVGFQAPAAISADVLWELPAADGTNGQILGTNGSGVLAWVNDTGSIFIDGGNFDNGSSTVTTTVTIDGGSFV